MKWKSILIISVVTIILTLFLVVRVQNNVPTAPYLFLNTLTAEKKQDRYIIRISQVGEEEKYVIFSEAREVLKTKGVTLLNPLTMEDIQTYMGMNFTDVIGQYSKPHTNIGSGFSIPAYITNDAYLISFQVDHNGVVVGVAKKDLCSTGDG